MANFKTYTATLIFYSLLIINLFSCKLFEEVKTPPTVLTNSTSNITINSAKIFGEVSSEGTSNTNERGFVYSSQNPTPNNSDTKVTSGLGKGEFNYDLSNITPNTKYFYRAYAINSVGISFGAVRDFTTLQAKLPTVSTNPASNITFNSVTTGAIISSDGGSTITEKGIVFASSPNPTTANNKITNINNQFTIELTALEENTIYYIRAFATNSVGTTYGDQISITTLKNINNSLKNGMVAFYPFNGNSSDISGKNNHLIENNILNMFDRFGLDNKTAYYFNGKDSYLTGPILPELKTQITISFWVKNKRTSSPTGWRCLITTQNSISQGFLIQDNENLKYDFTFANSSKTGYVDFWTSNIAKIEIWEYLTFSYDGKFAKFYRNGILENTKNLGTVSLESTAKLYVGSRYNNEFFLGVLDELGIWNRVLSEDEINYLFQKGYRP